MMDQLSSLKEVLLIFVTLSRLSPLSWWSGFKLSVKSNQAITLALVLVLPRSFLTDTYSGPGYSV